MKFFAVATLMAAVAVAFPSEFVQDNEKRCEGLDCNVNTIVARDAEPVADLTKRGGYYGNDDYDDCVYYNGYDYCDDYYGYGNGYGYGGRGRFHGRRPYGGRGRFGGRGGYRGRGHFGGRHGGRTGRTGRVGITRRPTGHTTHRRV